MTDNEITVEVNGDLRKVASVCSLTDLLQQLELNQKYVAVEVNQTLVPRQQHDAYQLQRHDRLEIVTLVGGG